jgi:hypothetical protein
MDGQAVPQRIVPEPGRPVPLIPGPAAYLPAIPGPAVPLLEAIRHTRSIRTEFYDPGGERYGLPTYPFKWAPEGWLTRRQLRAQNLRPGGQQPCGQLLWKHRGKRRQAWLYLRSLALPVRPMTPAKWAAWAAAMVARMTCPECDQVMSYCIPTSIGMCNDCAARSVP